LSSQISGSQPYYSREGEITYTFFGIDIRPMHPRKPHHEMSHSKGRQIIFCNLLLTREVHVIGDYRFFID